MDYQALEEHIKDSVMEEQAKLGFRKEVIRLYYCVVSAYLLSSRMCTFVIWGSVSMPNRLGTVRLLSREKTPLSRLDGGVCVTVLADPAAADRSCCAG